MLNSILINQYYVKGFYFIFYFAYDEEAPFPTSVVEVCKDCAALVGIEGGEDGEVNDGE